MSFKDRVLRFLNLRKRYRLWQRVVGSLAVVVVFVTTYMLILPAITMENGVYCGMEEHTHTDDCYTTALVCTEGQIDTSELDAPPEYKCTESLHTHTSDCYDENGTLVCGKADFFVHTHNDLCYFDGELVCPLEETEPHTHTEDCFTEETRYICGLEESEGHTHSDSCYSVTEELVCGLEESEEHSHDDSCYERNEELVCGLEESEGHTHDDSCMTTVRTLVCDKAQAHIHDESCYENGQLICGLPEIREHVHSAECMSADGITSGHVHTADCYEKVLSCGMEEHTHTDDCHNKSLWEGAGDSVTSGSGLDNVESGASLMTADEPMPIANIAETKVTITKGTDKYTAHITQKENNSLLREIIEGLGIEYHQGSYEGYNDAVLVDIESISKEDDSSQLTQDEVDALLSAENTVTVEVANINLSGNKGERRLIVLPASEASKDYTSDPTFKLTNIDKDDTQIKGFTFTTTADKLSGTLCFVSEKIFGGYVSSIEIKEVTDGSAFWDSTTSYDPKYYDNVKYYVRSNLGETGTVGTEPQDIPYDELIDADHRNETEKGYDNDPHNGIVRSFDNVVYDLTISTALRESAVEYYESDHVKLYLEIRLPKDISEANFDMENMIWMNDPLIKYVNIDPATKETKYIMWRDSEVSETGEPIFHKYKDSTKDERNPDDISVGSSLNMLNNGTPKVSGEGEDTVYNRAYRTPQVGGDSSIDINCQILTGYVELTSSSGGLVLPGTTNLSASINVLASADGDVIQPTFNAYILGNNENLGAEQETLADETQEYKSAEPVDCSNTAGVITKANTTNSFNVNNEIVIVTAAPRYDAHIRLNQDLKRVGNYDFTNGVEYDPDADGDHANSKKGRLMGYGVTLQLYNKTDNRTGHDNTDKNQGYFEKGMKGIELPAGDIEFDISFTATDKNVPKSDKISLPVGGDPLLNLDSENSDTHVITADGEAVAYEDYEAAILEEQLNNDDTVNGIVGRTIVSIISDDSDEVVSYVDETSAEDSENIFNDDTEETSPTEETDPTDENVGPELESRTLIKAVSYAAMPVAEVISQSMAVGAPQTETPEPASDPTDEEYGIMPIATGTDYSDSEYCSYTVSEDKLTHTWDFSKATITTTTKTFGADDTLYNLYFPRKGVRIVPPSDKNLPFLNLKNVAVCIPIPLENAKGGKLEISVGTINANRTIKVGNHTFNLGDVQNNVIELEIHKTDIQTIGNTDNYVRIEGNNDGDIRVTKIVFRGTETPPVISCDSTGEVIPFGECTEDTNKKTTTWDLTKNIPVGEEVIPDNSTIDGGVKFIENDNSKSTKLVNDGLENVYLKLGYTDGKGDGLRIPLPAGTTGGKLTVDFTPDNPSLSSGATLTLGNSSEDDVDSGKIAPELTSGKPYFFRAAQILDTAALAAFTAFPYATVAAGDGCVEIYTKGGEVRITNIALTYDTPNGDTYGDYNFVYGTKTKTWDFTDGNKMPMLPPTAINGDEGYNKVSVENGGNIHGIEVDLTKGSSTNAAEVKFVSYNHGTGDPWYYLSVGYGAILKLPVPPTTKSGTISVTGMQEKDDRWLIVGNNGVEKTDLGNSNKLAESTTPATYNFSQDDIKDGYLYLYTDVDKPDMEIKNIELTYQATATAPQDHDAYGKYNSDDATRTCTWGFGKDDDMPDYDSVEITETTKMEGGMSLVKGTGTSYFHNPDAEGGDPYLFIGDGVDASSALKIPVPKNTESGKLTITPFETGGKVGIGTAAAAGASLTTISGTSAVSITFTADNIDDGFIYLWCDSAKISSISMKYDNTGLLNAYIYFPTKDVSGNVIKPTGIDETKVVYDYYKDSTTYDFKFGTGTSIISFNNRQFAPDTSTGKTDIGGLGEFTIKRSKSELEPKEDTGTKDARITINVPEIDKAQNYKLLVGAYSSGDSARNLYLFDKAESVDGKYKYQTGTIEGVKPDNGASIGSGRTAIFESLEGGKSYTLAINDNFGLYYIALIAYSVAPTTEATWLTDTPPVTPDVRDHRKGVYIYFNDSEEDIKTNTETPAEFPIDITYGRQSDSLKMSDVFSRSKVLKRNSKKHKVDLGEYGTYKIERTSAINSGSGDGEVYNSIMFITVPSDVKGAKLKVGAEANSKTNGTTRTLYLVDCDTINNKKATVQTQTFDKQLNDDEELTSGHQKEFLNLEPGKTYALMGYDGEKFDSFMLFYVLLETYDYKPSGNPWKTNQSIGQDITPPVKESPATLEQGRPDIPEARNGVTPVLWDYKPNIAYTKYGEWGRFLDWDKGNERTNFAKQAAPYNSGYATNESGAPDLQNEGRKLEAVPGWDEQQIYWGGDWKVTNSIINGYTGKNDKGQVWTFDSSALGENSSKAEQASTTEAKTSTYHVKVSDYTFDFDFEGADGGHFPTSFAKETYGTDRHSQFGFGSFVRAFSSGYFTAFIPIPDKAEDQYYLTATITNFHAKSISENEIDREQYLLEQDKCSP